MANTVPILGYANTFGDWVVATNANSNEINSIGKANWTKDSGQLILNGGPTSLQVGNNAIIQGQLQVTGTASSATIDNNLTVDGQVYLTNTSQSLSTSGIMYANGTVYASNTGIGLRVANNTSLGGYLSVAGNTNIANTLTVTQNTTLQGNLAVSFNATVAGSANVVGNIVVQNNSFVYANSTVNNLQSNNVVNTTTISVVSNTYSGNIIANSAINTATLVSSGLATFNSTITVANGATIGGINITPFASAAYTAQNTTANFANAAFLVANSASSNTVTTQGVDANQNTVIASAQSFANSAFLVANSASGNTVVTQGVDATQNTNITSAQSFANSAFLVANSASSNTVTTQGVDATQNTNITAVTNNAAAAFLVANSASSNTVTTQGVDATQNTNITLAQSYANSAFVNVNNVISGAQTIQKITVSGQSNTADIGVSGNVFLSANSTLYVPKFLDMQTSTASANIYNLAVGSGGLSVLGNFTIQGSTIYNTPTFILSTGTPLVGGQYAQFGVFRTANNSANGVSANSYIRWNETNGRFDVTANALGGTYSNMLLASDISDSTSTTSSTKVASSTAVRNTANLAQAAYDSQNTTLTYAQAGYAATNTAGNNITTIQGVDTTQNTNITNVTNNAAAAFLAANAAQSTATTANSAGQNWLTFKSSGGTIGGDVGIIGNLFVNGNTSYINVATFQTVDSLIELAANNLSDTVDIGFYGQYASSGTKYSGLARKAAGNYILFQGVSANPTSNSIGTIAADSYATLNANIAAGFITVNNRMENYGVITNSGTTAGIMGGTSNGTFATPTQTPNNTTLYSISSLGYTGTSWTSTASLNFVSTEATQAASRGSKIVMTAIPAGGSTGYNLTWDGNNLNAAGTNLTGNLGTVTSVGGTGTVSGLTLTGTVTTSGSLTLGGSLSVSPGNFANQNPNLVLAGPSSGSAAAPTFRALVAADIPALPYGGGSVTNVSALTLGTAGSDLNSSVTNSTTTPVITLNVPTANSNTRGALSSTDWNTFNNKQATLGTANATISGILSSTDWNTFNGKQAALSTASASVSGILSSTDWNTFNSKQPAGSYVTSGGALGTPSSGTLTNCTFPTLNQNTTGSAGSVSASNSSDYTPITLTNSTSSTTDNTTLLFNQSYQPAASGYRNTGAIRWNGTAISGANGKVADITVRHSGLTLGGNGSLNSVMYLSTYSTSASGTLSLGSQLRINAGQMGLQLDSTGNEYYIWTTTAYQPVTDAGVNLGTSSYRFNNIYGYKANLANTDNSTSTTTGAIVTAGGIGVAQDVYAGGSVTALSDRRLKDNLEIIPNALEKVCKVNGYTYTRNDFNNRKETGVIAQEILEILPEAVFGSADTTYSVAYGNMMGLMIEAIKELKAEIEELKKGK